VKELHEDPTVVPRPKVLTRGKKRSSAKGGGADPATLTSGGSKWRGNFSNGPHAVAPNRLEELPVV